MQYLILSLAGFMAGAVVALLIHDVRQRKAKHKEVLGKLKALAEPKGKSAKQEYREHYDALSDMDKALVNAFVFPLAMDLHFAKMKIATLEAENERLKSENEK